MKTRSPEKKNSVMRAFAVLLCALLCLALPQHVGAAGGAAATLTVSQEIVTLMDPSNETRDFTYELKATDGGPLPESSVGDTYTFTMAGTPKKIEIPITFDVAGEYTYTLRCVGADEDEGNKFDIDGRVYTVKAYAEDTTAGLQVWIFVHAPAAAGQTLGSKVDQNEVSLFVHERTKYPGDVDSPQLIPVEVDPPIRKQIKGTPKEKDTFTFRLRAIETTSGEDPMPMPEDSANGEKTMTIEGAAEGEFGSWQYTQAGTYVYEIAEIKAEDNPDYNYDKRLFTITDVVTIHEVTPVLSELRVDRTIVDSDGRQVAHTLITPDSDNEKASPVVFTNEYIGEPATQTPPQTPTQAPTSGSSGRTGTSSGSASSGKTGSVKTGDRNRQIFWISLLSVAGLSFLFLLAAKRRRREKE